MKRKGSYLTGSISAPLYPLPGKSARLETTPEEEEEEEGGVPCDTEAALLYLKGLFPRQLSAMGVPPIVMKHQAYSIVHDKTIADREMLMLRDSGRVRLFKLGEASDDFAVVFSSDYLPHVTSHLGGTALSSKFLQTALPSCRDVSVSKARLKELHFSDEEISVLVNKGVLLVRDVGKNCSWWFAVPGISPFTKSYTKGRAMVQQMIKRSKYKEILQRELEGRKLGVSKLGMEYHIHDLIGAELVETTDTTSGPLLRLTSQTSSRNQAQPL